MTQKRTTQMRTIKYDNKTDENKTDVITYLRTEQVRRT